MRFVEAVQPRRARGRVAEVYAEVKRDFALLRDPDGNSPFLAHSPEPSLLEAFWSVLYETMLVDGRLRRPDKEAIAAAVSRANACPFCVDAHSLLGGAAGEWSERGAIARGAGDALADQRRRELVEWAASTRDPASELVRRPPFGPEEAPEAIGTAVGFHYVNRVVTVFQGEAPMNLGPGPLRRPIARVVGAMAGRAVRRTHEPGRTLRSLPRREPPPDLDWAAPAPHVAGAFAALWAAAEAAGAEALDSPARAAVDAALDRWDGDDPPLGGDWVNRALQGLEPASLPGARLALLVALAPYRVDAVTVDRFRATRPGDDQLVSAVCWAAARAARRVAGWLSTGDARAEAATAGERVAARG